MLKPNCFTWSSKRPVFGVITNWGEVELKRIRGLMTNDRLAWHLRNKGRLSRAGIFLAGSGWTHTWPPIAHSYIWHRTNTRVWSSMFKIGMLSDRSWLKSRFIGLFCTQHPHASTICEHYWFATNTRTKCFSMLWIILSEKILFANPRFSNCNVIKFISKYF